MTVEIPRYVADPEQGATLRNGTSVRVRAIRPDDEPRLMALCRHLSPRTVYQRFFSVDDVAQAALYLASDDTTWTTGTILTVDGGIMAQ